MPPEPLSWDRKDSEPRLAGDGSYRWRKQQHHHPNAPPPPPYYQQRQQHRWYSDIRSPRLLPPGNDSHGGRHMYSDEGYQRLGSRYADRNLEDENFRSFGARDDGGYFRNNREYRGPFTRKEWKPRSWGPSKSPNTPSRGSYFSHPSSSKSVEVGPDYACGRSTSPAQYEDNGSRKKPRLGWGQGLAKLEKKEVEGGPENGAPKYELVRSVSSTETTLSRPISLPFQKSPRVASLSDCASPGTQSSAACASSLGIEVKECAKEANTVCDRIVLSCPPNIVSQSHYTTPAFNLENLDLASITNVSSLIEELLQSDDPETGHGRTTSMNKLLVWKVDMLKALEMTESELESLETELNSLIAEPRIRSPSVSHSQRGDEQLEECEGLDNSSKCGIRLNPLQIDSCGKMVLENEPVGPDDVHVDEEGSRTTSCEDLAGARNVNCDVNSTHDLIFSSNRDSAKRATDQLNELLPKHIVDSSIESISSLERESSVVKEKFLRRKRFLLFKEKVLTLKFKVFQNFWKEGRIVSIRKLRGKTQKKLGPCRNFHKKNLSSSRSRVSSYAGGLQKVPADEIIEYINILLSESTFKPYRNTLKMPALILDKEVKMSRFISNNGLMEDPCGVEKERSMINPWTLIEKEIFIDKLAAFGKDFTKIASFLDHKTVADCVEFYYKNHKSECFEKTRKNPGCRKSQPTAYLVASGKRRNRELNAASLDILSAASEIVANIDNGTKSCRAPVSDNGLLQGSDSTNTYGDERETEAADVLASICGSLSSEAVSSCITSCVDHPMVRPLTPEVTQDVDDECSDDSWAEVDPTDWSDEEKSIFIRAVSIYGKDFSMISECVQTRSMDECKLFFSKARKCLGLDLIGPGPAPESGDGDSDVEDGCTMETIPSLQPSGNVSHPSIPVEYEEPPKHHALSAFCANGISGTESCQNLPVNSNSDWHEHFTLEKHGESRQQSGMAEAPFPSIEQITEPSGNGDVKLFGTILISSEQKTNNFAEQTDGNSRQDHKVHLDCRQS